MIKNLPANARDVRDTVSVPGSGRSPGGGCKIQGQRSLAGYSPSVHTESDTTLKQHTITDNTRYPVLAASSLSTTGGPELPDSAGGLSTSLSAPTLSLSIATRKANFPITWQKLSQPQQLTSMKCSMTTCCLFFQSEGVTLIFLKKKGIIFVGGSIKNLFFFFFFW